MKEPATTKVQQRRRLFNFEIALACSQFFGFLMVVLGAYYLNTMGWGLSWPQKGAPYKNMHGFLMMLGLVFFQGEALLSYRLYRYDAKLLSKFVHVVFHCLAIALFITGLVAIITQKNEDNYGHFYSAHSWIGISAMFIYVVQFAFGAINFMFPGIDMETREAFMPIHRVVGCISMALCSVQAIIGLMTYGTPCAGYAHLSCPNGLEFVNNFLIISIVLYMITVLGCVLPVQWRREKTLDEMQ